MGSNGHGKLLIGKQQIMGYLSIGAPAFYDFIKMGMPARVIQNRWYAHTDNIDLFFKQITLRPAGGIPEDAE
jgi:uncharacterized membrane protein YpjA